MSLCIEDLLENHSETLRQLTLGQIVHFVTLASRLKDDILLTQPAHISPLQPPDVLPPSITSFLSDCCGLSEDLVDSCWDVLKDMAWQESNVFKDHSEMACVEYGHSRGLSRLCNACTIYPTLTLSALHSLYPPQHTCIQPDCA
jgi:hypothetical protein